MKFLRSKYMLVLLLVILLPEVLIRFGLYEPLANPTSYAGRTVYIKNALRDFGRDKVNVLTLGDSRAAMGLNHLAIFEASRLQGLNHVRFAMPGSHFMTFKTVSAWGMDELAGLRGIVLAVSPFSFGHAGNGAHENAIVLPVRNAISGSEIRYHVPFKRSDLRTWTSYYSAAGYRDDFKELLTNPNQRLAKLARHAPPVRVRTLTYNNENPLDLCAVSTADPQACLDELERVQDQVPAKPWRALNRLCQGAFKERVVLPPGAAEQKLIDAWLDFFERLSSGLRVMVVLMPDHSLFQQHGYAPNARYVMERTVFEAHRRGLIDLADFRELMKQEPGDECRFFADGHHLNAVGKDVLTEALIPELEKFWGKL
jgi:hypothetical protein